MSGRIVTMHYKQDSPGRTSPYPGSPYLPFSRFCTSARVQGLALQIARDISAVAKAISPESDEPRASKPKYKDSFFISPGKKLRIDGLLRSTALVGNHSPKATAIEFGSGEPNRGASQEEGRPQGGHNYPYRVLGRAGRHFGDWHE